MIDPNEPATGYGFADERTHENNPGMTIRTQLAAMALQGICSNGSLRLTGKGDDSRVAKAAINMADLLISELNKTETAENNKLADLQHFKDSSIGLFCIDQDPKTVSHEWIVEHAFQLK